MIPRLTQQPMPGYSQQPQLGVQGMGAIPSLAPTPAMNQLPGINAGAPGTMAGLDRASPGMPANQMDARQRLAMLLG